MSFMPSAVHSIQQSHFILKNNHTNENNYKITDTKTLTNTSPSSSLTMVDTGDTNYEIKTEFYTREGVWKQVPNGEYIRQLQQQQQNVSTNQYQQIHGGMNGSGVNANNGSQQSYVGGGQASSSNDPVKIGVFKYSKRSIFKKSNDGSSMRTRRKSFRTKLKCSNCHREQSDDENNDAEDVIVNEQENNNSQDNSEYDDDDDVIFTKVNNFDSDYDEEDTSNDEDEDDAVHDLTCKYCKQFLKKKQNDENDKRLVSNSLGKNEKLKSLDLMLFNYAREIYFYEFNPVKSKELSENRNLLDKRMYKTFMSTCFDINSDASIANTIALQTNSSPITTLPNDANSKTELNLTPSCLSLIVAAGFNRGEIHVFDAFKKDASVFFNNTKIIEKTKVTCIKWLPKSLNYFLVGHSSGNMYLYDAANQTQSNVAPVFNKLFQSDSFSIYTNNNASSSTCTTTSQNSTPMSSHKTIPATSNSSQNNNNDSSLSMPKLVLSNNPQLSQVAKNPVLKLTIGSTIDNPLVSSSNSSANTNTASSNTPTTSNASSSSPSANMEFFMSNASTKSVNEFSFSPCGSYLAVVSQDGFLRVFTFIYHNNQQMQIQLKCSMKSYFGGLLCVSWSPDGRYIATGGEDDLITVFSFVNMKVACRGRGHSSWINCCAFDPWTRLNYSNNLSGRTRKHNSKSQVTIIPSNRQTAKIIDKTVTGGKDDVDNESDLEEYHMKNTQQKIKNINLNSNNDNKNLMCTPKKRTISTLSDFGPVLISQSSVKSQKNKRNNTTVYYRLASCGQDNQICFWDLTDDVLKEKSHHPPQHSNSTRSKLGAVATTTSQKSINNTNLSANSSLNNQSQLPQIIIQPMDLLNKKSNENQFNTQTNQNVYQQHNQQQIQSNHKHHHSAASSIVSTAKSLFTSSSSSKHNVNNNNNNNNNNNTDENSNGTSNITNTATSFFRKHKRNASNNSNTSSIAEKTGKSSSNKVTLNSYKQVTNNESLITANTFNNQSADNYSNESGINSLNSSNSIQNQSWSKKNQSSNKSSNTNGYDSNTNNHFNLCPKLDEVQIIEPLICKRIAKERLTSLVFKKDCFIVSTIDGYINTWARPSKINNKYTVTSAAQIDKNEMQKVLNNTNDSRINSTSL